MSPMVTALLTLLVFLASALYASVGHTGASGDSAAMGLVGVPVTVMKPIALVLNLFVATIGTYKFYRAGYFSWALFLPCAIASVPFAYIGGRIILPTHIYRPVVGGVLFYAAFRLVLMTLRKAREETVRPVPLIAALAWGAFIGLLSGLTGVGGGIFLSPLLILMRWAETRQSAGVSAAFILANSVAGLAGNVTVVHAIPKLVFVLVPAAALGRYLGAEFGSKRLDPIVIRRLLAVALSIAGLKMILPPEGVEITPRGGSWGQHGAGVMTPTHAHYASVHRLMPKRAAAPQFIADTASQYL